MQKVSVFCLTYNHVDTIRQTLESFVTQKTDFSFNVFVFDDASTDGTSDIVREFAQKYPDIFDVIISARNTYHDLDRESMFADYSKKYITGQYVAWCEGDDCWIDNNKLQMQVDFLDNHPECSLVVHDSLSLDCRTGEVQPKHAFGDDDKFLSPEEFILQYNGCIAAASMMYRNKNSLMPEFFYGWGVGDIIRQLYCLTIGKVYYMSRVMSLYRFKRPGSWSDSMEDHDKYCAHAIEMLSFLARFSQYTNQKYETSLISLAQLYIDTICAKFEKKYNDTFNKYIDFLATKYKGKNMISDEFFNQLKIGYQRGFDEEKIDSELRSVLDEANHIYIFGSGEFGTILANKLIKNGYEFDGFLNSSQGISVDTTYMGKHVNNINSISDDKDTLILVGVSERIYADILKYFAHFRKTVICWPFKVLNKMDVILPRNN